MLEKLNTIYENIKSTIITEAISVDKLKLIINKAFATEKKSKLEKSENNAEWFLRRLKAKLPYQRNNTNENIQRFIAELTAENISLTGFEMAKKYMNFILSDMTEKTEVMMELDDLNNTEPQYFNEIFDFNPQAKLPSNIQRLLSSIDAGNLNADDVKEFTADEFKLFNRKIRAEYTYLIGIYNDSVVGCAEFQTDGSIYWVEGKTPFFTHGETINLKQLLNSCDSILCIKTISINNARMKNSNRYNNAKYAITDPKKRDFFDRKENQSRYSNTIWKNKNNKIESKLKNELQTVMAFAKSVGIQAKQLINDDDLFDGDNRLTEKFHELITLYKECLKLSKNVFWLDEHKIHNLLNKLNYTAKELESAIGDFEEDVR